jgi:hypothetical protein
VLLQAGTRIFSYRRGSEASSFLRKRTKKPLLIKRLAWISKCDNEPSFCFFFQKEALPCYALGQFQRPVDISNRKLKARAGSSENAQAGRWTYYFIATSIPQALRYAIPANAGHRPASAVSARKAKTHRASTRPLRCGCGA